MLTPYNPIEELQTLAGAEKEFENLSSENNISASKKKKHYIVKVVNECYKSDTFTAHVTNIGRVKITFNLENKTLTIKIVNPIPVNNAIYIRDKGLISSYKNVDVFVSDNYTTQKHFLSNFHNYSIERQNIIKRLVKKSTTATDRYNILRDSNKLTVDSYKLSFICYWDSYQDHPILEDYHQLVHKPAITFYKMKTSSITSILSKLIKEFIEVKTKLLDIQTDVEDKHQVSSNVRKLILSQKISSL